MQRTYDQDKEAFRGQRLPLAYVDLDLFDRNLESLALRAGGKPIRVASKSIRCADLLRRALAHPACSGILAYSAAEAAWLGNQGFDDILVAYPTVEPKDLSEAARTAAGGARITLMVDSPEQLPALVAAAEAADTILGLCIDCDMSTRFPGIFFGVRRSPLTRPSQVVELARRIDSQPRLRFVGIMGYEAQIAGVGEKSGAAPALLLRWLKRRSRPTVAKRRAAVVSALAGAGLTPELVNGGGTGSLESTGADPVVTEVTAGSGLFSPGLFDEYDDFRHLPAAGYAVPVVRIPGPGLVTCHGGGFVASGAASPGKLPRPYLPEGVRLTKHEGAGEVQTPLEVDPGTALSIGDPVLFRHAKSGELCEHFNQLVLIEKGRVSGSVRTYRGEGRCFL